MQSTASFLGIPQSTLTAAALAVLAALAPGCATDATEPDTGEVVIPLIQPGPHGELYHLRNATFDITDATGAVTTVLGGGFGPQVTATLPPGIASVQLRPGWTLERSNDGGNTFFTVGALLGSPNPNIVRVLANQPVFMEFDFLLRTTTGTLAISLGVVTDPRELAGGFIVDSATGGLAAYANPANRLLDFGVFFRLFSLESIVQPDGTKQRIYTAFGQQASFGPVPPNTGGVAGEFYNDHIGTLAGPIATDLTGASLTYTVSALSDGTFELVGSLLGLTTDIEFGPHVIDAVFPVLDPDGFPADTFWYDSTLPFTLLAEQGTLAGVLRMRHLLPPPGA
jgi:hypothetical protein